MKTRVLSVSLAAALAGSLMLAQPAANSASLRRCWTIVE